MWSRVSRGLAVISTVAAVLAVAAAPAQAALSVTVLDADLQPGGSSVQLSVAVACDAPAGSTSYLSTTLWQGEYWRTRYVEGQGQTEVICDGIQRTYSFTATTTIFYADKKFRAGRAQTESGVSYCVRIDDENIFCTGAGDLIRQRVRIRP